MQLVMICGTTVSSTDATVAATTGGPFRLPPWAPDMEWATTSEDVDWPVIISSTSPLHSETTQFRESINAVGTYTKRTFALIGDNAKAYKLLITYRAVGELTRT